MRACIVVSIVVFAACGGKKSDGTAAGGGSTTGSSVGGSGSSGAAAGSGAAGGSAGAAGSGGGAAAYCVPPDGDTALISFDADEKTATFCVGKESQEEATKKCTAVDLATGTFKAAASAPAAKPAPASDAFAVKQDTKAGTAEVCRGNACKKLDLPKQKPGDTGERYPYQISVSEDGKRVAAVYSGTDSVVFLDGTTGKKVRTVKAGDDQNGKCLQSAYIVGESVYVETSVCAGPGGNAMLYSWAGKTIGPVGSSEEAINVYGATPIPVGGDNWAVGNFGGGSVLVFSAKTGKQVHLLEVKRPEDCEACGSFLADAAGWRASPVVKVQSGKLVAMDSAGVSVLDPATGKVEKTYRTPFCAEKK
jgi:hypothetical protein